MAISVHLPGDVPVGIFWYVQIKHELKYYDNVKNAKSFVFYII